MAEMKKIQPLMQEIREKYKNDKKRMNEEVMALYRAYKVNPVGRMPSDGGSNTSIFRLVPDALPGD